MLNEAAIEKHVEPQRSDAEALLAVLRAPGWAIVDNAHAERMGALLVEVKRRYKTLDAFKKEIVGPFQNAVRNANASFARGLDPLLEIERAIKVALGVYEARIAAERKAAIQVAEVPPPPVAKLAGVTTRTVRRWRITDAERVPKQFCSPDPKKIDEHLRNGGIAAIPGVEFYDETITAVKT